MRDKAFGALLLLEFLHTAFLDKIEDSSLHVWKGSQRFSLHMGLGFFQKCWQCNAAQDEWESNHLRGFVAWLLPFTGAKWILVIWINSVVMISPKTSSLGLFRDTISSSIQVGCSYVIQPGAAPLLAQPHLFPLTQGIPMAFLTILSHDW